MIIHTAPLLPRPWRSKSELITTCSLQHMECRETGPKGLPYQVYDDARITRFACSRVMSN